MNIRKKGAAIGFTATLLASLIAVVAAPAAFAAASVTSAGTVPRGGTSTGTAAFTFTENSAACFRSTTAPAVLPDPLALLAGDELTVTLAPATVTFGGTPVVSGPGSLGTITATITGNVLHINWTNSDDFNIEALSVSGLTLSATAGTATGAVGATLTGNEAGCILGAASATGAVVSGIGIGSLSVIMNLGSTACPFVPTGTVTAGGTAGNLVFATGESVAISAVSAVGVPAAGQQTLTLATATTAVHNATEGATQANACASTGAIGSPGTVGNVLTQTVPAGPTTVLPGEQNQLASDTVLVESAAGFIPAGALTFTLSAAGVTFSASPSVIRDSGNITFGTTANPVASAVCSLSADRTSCSVPVSAASTIASTVRLTNIRLDVASTVPIGTKVNVTVTGAPTILISANTIAIVGRVIVGTAAQPTIFIGFNDQPSGLITLTESGPGFFKGGSGANNTFALCLTTGEQFTRRPFAVVTTGDLKLLDTATLGPTTSIAGTLFNAVPTAAPVATITLIAPSATATITGNTVSTAIPITAISAAATPVITAANTFAAGDTVVISGTNSVPSIDGTYVVAAGPTATTFTVTGAPATTATGSTGSVVRPTIITTAAAHGLVAGQSVTISGSNSTPSLNGTWTVATVPTTTTFTLTGAPTVTVAGSAGTVNSGAVITTAAAHGLLAGDSIVISGSNSTPSLNGTWTVATVTPTTFTVTGSPTITTAGTTGSVFRSSAAATGQCAYWTVYSASTTTSTIEIRGSDASGAVLPTGANNGPRLSVPSGLAPGSTQATILVGTNAAVLAGTAVSSVVSNAIRAFKSGVTVTAASQPRCLQGSPDCLAGNIVITETLNGQFKPGQTICVSILPRTTNGIRIQDTILKTANTNDLPIITTNSASGLLTSQVATPGCSAPFPVILPTAGFSFRVTQQSFGPTLGQITISNIHYAITADAPNGPVLVDVRGAGGSPTASVEFESIVSNAIIGLAAPTGLTKVSAASAIGKTQSVSAFTVSTKVVTLVSTSNNIVTIRFKLDPALVGKSVVVERAVKNSAGVWSSFTKLTTRLVGSDGYAYYYASAHSRQWLSFRGRFLGNATHDPSRSQAVQVRWR